MDPQAKSARILREAKQLYCFGSFLLDPSEHLLLRDGKPVSLTTKVFDLLLLLIRNRGHALTKDEIMAKLWPDTVVEENNLTVNMSALRKALSDDSSQPQYIETVPRRGYRFVAQVRLVDEAAAMGWPGTTEQGRRTEEAVMAADGAASTLGASHAGSRFAWPGRTKLALAGLSIALVALLLVSMARMPKSEPSIESLAVLPFVNGSADEQAEYLSDGITESLVNKLSQLPGLRVEARSTIFRYKGRDLDPVEIGRDLGVQAILTGTVVQRGDSLVVQAELVRVSNGAQIWGEHYNRRPADIFLVQEDVARRIAEASHLKITGAEQQHIARRQTEDIEAYDLYLKARYRERRSSADQVKLGIDYFRRAIAEDSNFALAYSELADSYVQLGTYYEIPPKEAFAEARHAATRAVELDPRLAEGYVSLGMVQFCYDWDWDSYDKNSRKAAEVNPNYAKNYYVHSQYLAASGRFEEAIADAKRALALESSLDVNANLGWILYFARRYDQAAEQFQKAIALDPDLFRAYRLLGLTYLQNDRPYQAIEAIQRSVDLSGSTEEKAYLGYAYGAAGKRGEALRVQRELKEHAGGKYVSPYLMALIAMGLGSKDEAMARLNEAYAARSVNLIYLNVDPIFDSLHSNPGFRDLVRRIGLPSRTS